MDKIAEERLSYLLNLAVISVLITAFFAALYILVIRKTIIMPIRSMVKAAESYLAPETGAASSSIGALDIKTNDELKSLALAMKSMDQKINLTIIELRKAEGRAQSASRTKTAFLAQMSHELRTPMNAIMGMTRAALYAADDQEKVVLALRQILASSQRLLTILNDILDISNIESGKLTLSRDAFSLADVCRSLNDLTRLQCRAKDIVFFPDTYQASNLIVWGDRLRLIQAAGNILNNAVKFTEKGGEVRFTATVITQTEKTAKLRFTISDTGIGISPEQQKILFEAFSPPVKDASVKYSSMGVNLSICQSIVEMMGGTITIESETGKGSVFSFEIIFDIAGENDQTLPGDDNGSPPIPGKHLSGRDFSGKKILVVDDVKANRAVVKIALRGTGAEVIEAGDGREAIEIVTGMAEEIDLILMDVSMPIMNGYEAARAIRAMNTGWARTIPIIALTAYAYLEDVDEALDAGMDFHLGKPLSFDTLLSTIGRYLDIK
jgi:signal transduction histidine kinase/ActR/RegA family two-component response regulator